MKSNQDKIFDLERKISDLKYLERDLVKERDIVRMSSLDRAEKSTVIEKIIKNVFLSTLKAERSELVLHSYQSKLGGRRDEEFLSEVKVDIIYKPENPDSGYSEMALSVYVDRGIENDAVHAAESKIMDRLIEIREEVDSLKVAKKKLKEGS